MFLLYTGGSQEKTTGRENYTDEFSYFFKLCKLLYV